MAQEIDRVNNDVANTIIKDSGIISYLIKKYFREYHNIDLGDFQSHQYVSKEIAALDISKNIITEKYNFFCALDYINARRVYIDVYIGYIVFENDSIDTSVPVTINRIVMKYPVDDDGLAITNHMIKKNDECKPLKIDGITKQSSSYEYAISAELDLSIDMKFIKKEENMDNEGINIGV